MQEALGGLGSLGGAISEHVDLGDLPVGRISAPSSGDGAGSAAGSGGAAPPNVDELAEQVFAMIKARLRTEHDRHSVYSR